MSDNWDPDSSSGANNGASGFDQKPTHSMGRGRLYDEEKQVKWASNADSSSGNWGDNKSFSSDNFKSNTDGDESSSGRGRGFGFNQRGNGNRGYRNNENGSNDSGTGFGNRENNGNYRGRGGYNRGGDRDNDNSRQWGENRNGDNGEERNNRDFGRGGYNRGGDRDNDNSRQWGENKNGDNGEERNRGGFGNRRGRGGNTNFGDEQSRDDDRGGFGNRRGRGGNSNFGDEQNRDDDRGGFGNRRGRGGNSNFGDNQSRDDDRGGFGNRRSRGGNSNFGDDQSRDDDRGGFGDTRNGDGCFRGRGGFGGKNRDGGGGFRGRGGFGGQNRDDNSGGFERKNRDGGGEKDGEEERPPPYCPPEVKVEDLFDQSIPCGINFQKYKNKQKANLSGNNPVSPIDTFEEAKLRPLLIENIKKANYESPTTVQQYVIPAVMAGRDIMACAQTGSGKTAAFLLPIIHDLIASNVESGQYKDIQEPYAVIVAPTRELAIQIHKEAKKFSLESVVRVVVLYGGTSTGYQIRDLKGGAHIVVATPGRLVDIIERGGLISLSKLRYLVLDEADRMLDMGFFGSIKKVFEHSTVTPKGERSTLMFSATFPEDVQKVANAFLSDYLFLTIGMVGGANDDVQQTFIQLNNKSEKNEKLVNILKENEKQAIIVFVEQKRIADFVCSYICQHQLKATSIHGDRFQSQREEALLDFRTRKFNILVATGVASRGLDIRGVDHVINYDMPKEIDEYVHRIGRTARLGNIGKSTSFIDFARDEQVIPSLMTILKNAEQEIPEWLVSIGDSASMGPVSFSKSQFGGRDYRTTGDQPQWDKPSNSGGTQEDAGDTWD